MRGKTNDVTNAEQEKKKDNVTDFVRESQRTS